MPKTEISYIHLNSNSYYHNRRIGHIVLGFVCGVVAVGSRVFNPIEFFEQQWILYKLKHI